MTSARSIESFLLQPLEEVNNNEELDLAKVKAQVIVHQQETTGQVAEEEEDVEDATIYKLNDSLSVTVKSPEEWLCVSRMPLDFTNEEFQELMQAYGAMEQSFLIHSEVTGTSKGYGLVKYVNKESSIQARHVLDGFEVRNGHSLNCDWLKHNRPGVTSLHSKCLYVDKLPPDYRDMAEFRRIFSKIVNPPYCQIAIKNGLIHNWGLVEFQTSREAEATMEALQGESIQGQPMRVQFCIPGVHAINIYMAFVNNPMDAVQERKALLDEAPTSKVYDQMTSLAKHNPWFVANLQNIMASSSMVTSSPALISSAQPTNVKHVKAAADPAQAALILFLAGKVAKGPQDQTASLVQTIVKQMALGIKASEILRSVVGSVGNSCSEAELIQAAINMSKVEAAKQQHKPKSDKCPLLSELLYKSFQAKLAREQKLKAPLQKSSPLTSSSSLVNPTVANQLQPPPASIPFQFNELLNVPPPATTAYPNYLYYSQLMPTPASAPANILYPGLVQPQQSSEAALALMMQQYQLQASFGVKRAAGPIVYGNNVEKRMKLV